MNKDQRRVQELRQKGGKDFRTRVWKEMTRAAKAKKSRKAK